MQESDKELCMLLATGALIAVAKVLTNNAPITLRLIVGRVILGSFVSVISGAVLLQIPGASPLAIQGLGAALGIIGYQGVELWLRKFPGKIREGHLPNDTE